MTQKPKKIKKINEEILRVTWGDDSESDINIKKLRDECPCVHCKGETVIFSSYVPEKNKIKSEGYYQIESIEPVGNYAINITWKDKHNTGIYSWELLKEIAEH
jgi:DUF971 family protein